MKISIIICIFAILILVVINEIYHFSIKTTSIALKIVLRPHVQQDTLTIPKQLHYADMFYAYSFVDLSQNLNGWCALIVSELVKTFRSRYPVVTHLYYFESLSPKPNHAFDFNLSTNTHFLIVCPLTSSLFEINEQLFSQKTAFVRTDPKQQTIKIKGDRFFVACCQLCKAWSL